MGVSSSNENNCKMDVTNFPFDSHDCEIKIYSSSILSLYFDVQPECSEPEILLGYYEGSPQWEITGSISFFCNHKYHEPPVVQRGGNLRNRISGHGIGPIFQKTHSPFPKLSVNLSCVWASILSQLYSQSIDKDCMKVFQENGSVTVT